MGFDNQWYLSQLAKEQAREAKRNPEKPLNLGPKAELESPLQDEIANYCIARGWMPNRNRMDVASTDRIKGRCDFIILLPEAKTLFVECKSRTGKLKPDQVEFIAWATKLGHKVHVVQSLAEFIYIL